MLGLIVGAGVIALLGGSAAVVLVLCARAPRADDAGDPAEQLSQLDLMDRTPQPSTPARVPPVSKPGRVA